MLRMFNRADSAQENINYYITKGYIPQLQRCVHEM